jgi:hypothetical protein
VASSSIVEVLDVVKVVGPSQLARLVDAFADLLVLEAAEEGFCYGMCQQLPHRLMLGSKPLVGQRDERGHLAVVRNGFHPERSILFGIVPVGVRVPKVRSRTDAAAVFPSSFVPPHMRRAHAMEAALPWLYLHGISTGDMSRAPAPLVGPEAAGLSAAVVSRLKSRWAEEYQDWRRTRLSKDR